MDVVTDGEMRRLSFQSQMTEAVEGFGEWDLDAFLWGEWQSGELGEMRVERPPIAVQGSSGASASSPPTSSPTRAPAPIASSR